jgi:hypothetical protein
VRDFDLAWLVFTVNRVEACAFWPIASSPTSCTTPCSLIGAGPWSSLRLGLLGRARTQSRSAGLSAAQVAGSGGTFRSRAEDQPHARRTPFIARTQYDYARMLRERGDLYDRARSDERIAEGLRETRTLGMTWLTARLEAARPDLIDVAGSTVTTRT